VDANQNENKVKIGDAFISLDIKSRAVFYEVEVVETRQDGSTWIKLAGLQFQDSVYVPLLFLDKSFAKVNKSTIQTLFGERKNKNGNAKQETSHAEGIVKSIRREGQRPSSTGRTTSVRQVVSQIGTRRGEKSGAKRPDQNGRNRSPKRD
jgi:hypothetical protein